MKSMPCMMRNKNGPISSCCIFTLCVNAQRGACLIIWDGVFTEIFRVFTNSDLVCFPGELLGAVVTAQLSLGAVMLQVLREITPQ